MCRISLGAAATTCLSLLFMLQLFPPAEEVRLRSPEASNLTGQPLLNLPVFVESKLPLVDKEQFVPARSAGPEALPERVRELLRPVRRSSTTKAPRGSAVSVKTSCKRNKMRVQVQRSILGPSETYSQLRLGSCDVSKTTRHHLYFEYDLGACGTKQTVSFKPLTQLMGITAISF